MAVVGAAANVRYLFAASCACVGALLLLSAAPRPAPAPPPPPAPPQTGRNPPPHTIATPGCTIPMLTPFDKAVDRFAREPVRIGPCHNPQFNFTLFPVDEMLANNDTHIWIQRTDSNSVFDSDEVTITCCYSAFYRPSVADVSSSRVDDRVQYEPCIYFTDNIEVSDEFVKVTCDYDNKTIFMQFFVFAPMKPRMPRIFAPTVDTNNTITESESDYNVIVLGIDSVSRLNFYRTMPKTLAFLKTKGAVEMLGYNKVGDNTFPNLVPMLLGMKVEDLKTTCQPNPRATFDNCPFVWEWFKDAGYYTALGEDSAWLGTFNYEKIGFMKTPTEYYIHTFMHEAEANVANNKGLNSNFCMGGKYFFNVLLDYIKSLTRTLSSSKLFGFFWEVTMTHDYVNYPKFMDDSYSNFLKSLDESKYLDKTILFVISDHGMRYGDMRFTKQGRLEERLPLLHILLPPSFAARHRLAYESLRVNSGRLTTPFDVHQTLTDLASSGAIRDDSLRVRRLAPYALERGISLWLEVPANRTCRAAGIDDHWCTCHRERRLAATSGVAHEAAAHLVRRVNGLLGGWRQCARLRLAAVLGAAELRAGEPRRLEAGWREYRVTARARPGGAVLEGTLRRDARGWTLAGAVSRLNLYGRQSHCVHDALIKLYCYCIDNNSSLARRQSEPYTSGIQ